MIGSIILQAINYGLYFLGVNAYLQYIIRGAIIIIAVAHRRAEVRCKEIIALRLFKATAFRYNGRNRSRSS